MQKEFNFTDKKKEKYPSKRVINLYYKEDKTTRPSTIALYLLFILVVCLAVAKLAVYDKLTELEDVSQTLEKNQAYLANQMEYLKDYGEVSSKYSRYSYSYLTAEEKICDRMDILSMLEETVFVQSTVETVAVSDNVISLNLKGMYLEDAARLAKEVEQYDIVARVEVNAASLNTSGNALEDTLTTQMVITLVSDEETGGEQS